MNGGSSHRTCSTASGSVMCPPARDARKRTSVRTIFRVFAMRFAVVSNAAIRTSRRCCCTSSSDSPDGCSISQVVRSDPGWACFRATSLRSVSWTNSLLATAVSVPFSMSRAALTSWGL